MKGNFKYSRFNDLEQQIQIESHKINVECIFFKGPLRGSYFLGHLFKGEVWGKIGFPAGAP